MHINARILLCCLLPIFSCLTSCHGVSCEGKSPLLSERFQAKPPKHISPYNTAQPLTVTDTILRKKAQEAYQRYESAKNALHLGSSLSGSSVSSSRGGSTGGANIPGISNGSNGSGNSGASSNGAGMSGSNWGAKISKNQPSLKSRKRKESSIEEELCKKKRRLSTIQNEENRVIQYDPKFYDIFQAKKELEDLHAQSVTSGATQGTTRLIKHTLQKVEKNISEALTSYSNHVKGLKGHKRNAFLYLKQQCNALYDRLIKGSASVQDLVQFGKRFDENIVFYLCFHRSR